MKVVDIKSQRADEWRDAAKYLRDLADRVEKGEITEAMVVINDLEATHYESWGFYGDRWRALGALEYTKITMQSRM